MDDCEINWLCMLLNKSTIDFQGTVLNCFLIGKSPCIKEIGRSFMKFAGRIL